MQAKRSYLVMFATAVLLAGCSGGGGWWPFGGSSQPAPERIPAGATEYACADNKRLLVRYTPDGKSAWVIYPDREFRLDRVASGSGERYTNGSTTLATQGDEVLLEADGARQFGGCKKK